MASLRWTRVLFALLLFSLLLSGVAGQATKKKGSSKGKGKAKVGEKRPLPTDESDEDSPSPSPSPASLPPLPPVGSPGEVMFAYLCEHFSLTDLGLLDMILEENGLYTSGAGPSSESPLLALLRTTPGLPRL
jgi:hypothetical protein